MVLAGGGGDKNGDSAAKRTKLDAAAAAAGEDRLSALPDDILVLILLHLHTSAEAAQTSVLSRRWRRVWALLPELRFPVVSEPYRLRDVLDAHVVSVRDLFVRAIGATPESLATWLPAAARRVSGHLTLHYFACNPDAQRRAFELPCFEKATSISLFLGFGGLAVPLAGVFARLAGVFARLTGIHLTQVIFHGMGDLGDAVSTPRCPCLQRLTIDDARGLGDLDIRSESLREMELQNLGQSGLSHLTVVAPALIRLVVMLCFHTDQIQPVATISAPQLGVLYWLDAYDPSFIQLGTMAHLYMLGVFVYFGYGNNILPHYRSCLRLMQRFGAIENLCLRLYYLLDFKNSEYSMEGMTMLPAITFLWLDMFAMGHAFGASSFHVLRLCTGIKRLVLELDTPIDSEEAQTVCPLGCICGQPTDWEIKELSLNHLEEVEIDNLRGSEHEFAFVKRLFNWGTALKKMTLNFYYSISEIKAKELYEMFQSFSRPGICIKLYYQNFSKLYAPED